MQTSHKAIPESRDRLQSRLLVWVVGPVLGLLCLHTWTIAVLKGPQGTTYWLVLGISIGFALIVRLLRAGTTPAALCGATICLLTTWYTAAAGIGHSVLPSLVALFILTFLATRAGKARKILAGLAESRKGRSASQVLANLATAGLVSPLVIASPIHPTLDVKILILAALAEATADTVSSELGQAFGGEPYLVTTFRRTAPGTDGAITLFGTAAGVTGALLITLIGGLTMHIPGTQAAIAFAAGTAGLLFDSLVGATLERRGYLGNDLVNFSSTLFAVAIAAALLML